MEEPLLELGRARGVGAAPHRLALDAQGDAAAGRAVGGHLERLGLGVGSLGGHDLDQVGDDVAGSLDQHGVAHAHVLPAHLVLVVQAHVGHRDAGQLDRLELRGGGERARLAHVDRDRDHAGGGLARRELVGDGPARVVGGGPEAALLLEVVDLDHDAVGVVAETVALGLDPPAVGGDRVEVGRTLRARVHPESALAERLEALPLRVEAGRLEHAHVVEEDLERPRGGHRRVLLAHRARRRVAGVGEDRLPRLLQARVEPREGLARHVDLAAHLEAGRALEGAGERGRDGLDRAQVLGDVLADAPVAPGGPPHQPAALVEQRDPEPVDLGLAHVSRRDAGQGAPQPGLELEQVLRGHRVVEREHGHQVLDRRE